MKTQTEQTNVNDLQHPDQSISGRYGRRFEKMIIDLTTEEPQTFEDQELTNFFKIIYSVCLSGEQRKVENLIRQNLPEFND